MFVTASVFQFAINLLEVLITAFTCTLFLITFALPTPIASIFFAFVTRSLILLNASLRRSCIVKLLVVTDPTKNLAPDATAVALTLNNSFDELPSDNDSSLIASPVVSPCPNTTTLLSTKLTVFLVSVCALLAGVLVKSIWFNNANPEYSSNVSASIVFT